ncbi:MAG TPA: NYN domain-containing protein [Pyrinomonadaceae bacterium]|nr:NYN domain-containing protein [Pyrinomonadaceae bacterium]
MAYLVDGNNVMGQRVGWHRDRVRARRELLEELARFALAKKVRVDVVFDGAPDENFADGSSYKGVRVYYAARGSNADERIKSLVEASRERRTLSVVTSDRALADYVRRCGAHVVRSGEFRRRMEESEAARASQAETDAPPIEETTERWMRYFGVAPEDDE